MKKAAILLAAGYEEGETLFVVDILRRADIPCTMYSTQESLSVKGGHSIVVQCDALLNDSIHDCDAVILPGGAGAAVLKEDARVLEIIREFDRQNKYIAAICAAPSVLFSAGITQGRTLTSYPGAIYKAMFAASDYQEELVVTDGNLITSRGPATTLPFAYAIVDALGGNSAHLKEKMLYHMLSANI